LGIGNSLIFQDPDIWGTLTHQGAGTSQKQFYDATASMEEEKP